MSRLRSGPVDGEPVRLVGGDTNEVGVQELANTSPGGHELGGAGVEAVQLLYVVHHVVHGLLGDLERPGDLLGVFRAIGLLLSQPLHRPVLRLNDLLGGCRSWSPSR